MPLQNRVDPWGNLIAVEARGAWMGNRGILHDAQQQIIAPWKHKAWVTCQLEFQGRRRTIFSPNNYSELFFLDEATAFSAGHRPCAECRRARYKAFKEAWCAANGVELSTPIAQIDKQLHAERAARGGGKITFTLDFERVPDGAFIDGNGHALLKWRTVLKRWSPTGYENAHATFDPQESVTVLTPQSIVRLYAAGFSPQVHASVEA